MTEHWSSPNGCHPDCPACAEENHHDLTIENGLATCSCGEWEYDEVVTNHDEVTAKELHATHARHAREEISDDDEEFKFKPDKCADDSPLTNGQRADNGMECIKNVFDFGQNDIETACVDTIANIFHLCDKNGFDINDVVRTALNHWKSER